MTKGSNKSGHVDRARPTARTAYAYAEIRRRILDGEFAAGEPLSEYQLAAQLHASRTPIREALRRLEHEGLVRLVLNRGAFVAGISVIDIVEIYQVRELLEGFAARVAADEMTEPDIEALSRELEHAKELAAAGRVEDTFQSDIHLHKQLIGCTKNRRLAAVFATLEDQVHRIRLVSPTTPGRLEATLREHQQILECIKRRDGDAAQQAMIQHLRAARENAMRLLTMLGGFDDLQRTPRMRSELTVRT